MAVDTALIDAGKTELSSLEIEDALPSPATEPQQKTNKVNNPTRMAAVECCNRTVVPSDAVEDVLVFLFIYFRRCCFNVASTSCLRRRFMRICSYTRRKSGKNRRRRENEQGITLCGLHLEPHGNTSITLATCRSFQLITLINIWLA